MGSGNRQENTLLQKVKLLSSTDTLAGEYTLDVDSPTVQVLDPGGASRDVLLPAEADAENLIFVIFNAADASENLVVKEDSDTTTIVTIAQNEGAILHCNGTDWKGIVGANT